MIDDSCEVPREDLDDGFNPCRKQVVENGELEAYAHMYDVMNERYDREEDTSYLNSVKRDRITQSTPSQTVGEGKLYAQDGQGVEGFVKSSGTLDPTTNAEIPSSKAVADYVSSQIPDISDLESEIEGKLDKEGAGSYNRVYTVDKDGTQYTTPIASSVTPNGYIPNNNAITDYAPIPLPVSKGGTGGNTPYVTDDLDASAIFVMHDAPNDRYDAAPMSALTGYLDDRYNNLIPTHQLLTGNDLNELTYGTYYTSGADVSNSLVNKPYHTFLSSVRVDHYANGSVNNTKAQLISENQTGTTFYRYALNNVWSDWNLLYPTPSRTIPNPLPVDQGGTGAQTRSLKTAAGLTLLPVIDSIGASGALNGYTSVTNIATFITTNNIRPEITAAFENHIADAVADNDLLPTNALMMDYVAAHAMDTPPDKFSFKVSPFPSGTWEGEMNINVVPVFATTIGSVTYVVARVYGSKIFNYTGSADNINLFSSLKPVEEYTNAINNSTDIPLTLSVRGRSSTPGTYGFTPNGSTANLSLNNQIMSSVFYSGDFGISNNLKCVFGEGTNTPAVTVSVNCMALMWYSPM